MRRTLLFGLALVLAGASAVAADVVYIPIPETGGAGLDTQVEVHPDKGGPQTMSPAFIAVGTSGKGKSGAPTNVNNYFRPFVFQVTQFIDSAGLLKLDGDASIKPTDVAMLVTFGSQDAGWRLPIIRENSWFAAGSTAYFQGLYRNDAGAVNMQIVNVGRDPANCEVQLVRPKGTFIGDPLPATVPPISSIVMDDILAQGGIHRTVGRVRAQVTCDQNFYPLSAFASSDRTAVRIIYPHDGPPVKNGDTVTMDFNGTFFRPSESRGELTLDVPLVPNHTYRKLTLDFDMAIADFSPVFDVLVGLYHRGGPRFNTTLYFGTFIRGDRHRWVVDMGSPWLEVDQKYNAPFTPGFSYHVAIVYDAENALFTSTITDPKGNLVLEADGGAFNLDLANRNGNTVQLNFGQQGIADFAYFPPINWRFSNMHLEATE